MRGRAKGPGRLQKRGKMWTLCWADEHGKRCRTGLSTDRRTAERIRIELIRKRDLAQAVPPIRAYQLSHVPCGLSEEEAQKVLECIDRTTPVGRRDFAILQLLYTYGVRGGQIRALRLQDIQWRAKQIHFPAHKGGKPVRVPLTEEAGEAVAARAQALDAQLHLPAATLARPPSHGFLPGMAR